MFDFIVLLVPEKEKVVGGEGATKQDRQTNKNNSYQFLATCKLNFFFNDFIRTSSIFYLVIHFPEATLHLAGRLTIPIRIECV